MGLIDLPSEIRGRIAEHVPIQDCQHLAITHSSLRDIAESQIWATVDTLEEYDQAMHRHGHSEDEDDILRQRDMKMPGYLSKLRSLSSVMSRSGRGRLVTTLRIAIPTDLQDIACEILKMVQSSVQNLTVEIACFEWTHPYIPPLLHLGAFQRVKILTIRIPPDLAVRLGEINDNFPNMETLRLIHCSSSHSSFGFEKAPPDIQIGRITRLEVLSTHDDAREFIIPLLKVLNGVRRFKLTMHEEWICDQPPASPKPVKMIPVIKEYKSIEHFEYGRDDRWGALDHVYHIDTLFDGSGWENLRTVTIGGGVEMESETYIENIHLPNAPGITSVIVSCRNRYWCAKVKTDLGKAPPPRQMIAPTTYNQLRQCSSLLRVIFGIHEQDPPFDPLEWCNHRISGVIIREYTNGEDTFFHLRRMELTKSTPKVYGDDPQPPPRCTGAKCHRWVDHTRYKGYRVMDDTLDKVYKVINGEGKDWITPGRGLQMPDKAWRHLQRGLKEAMRT